MVTMVMFQQLVVGAQNGQVDSPKQILTSTATSVATGIHYPNSISYYQHVTMVSIYYQKMLMLKLLIQKLMDLENIVIMWLILMKSNSKD